MANPMKVLTQLSASKEVQFADVVEAQKTVSITGAEAHLRVTGGGEISGSGNFKAAGAAQLGSTLAVAGDANLASALDVKGAAALSGSLGVVGAADLQSTLAVAGNADLNGELDVQGAANFQSNADIAGYAKVVGELSGSAALNIGGAAHVAGNAQFDAELNVDGAADFDSTLDVAGNVTMQASASLAGDLDMEGNADIAGNLDVHGNAVVYGNLDVKGTMTTIESTTVTVADANIQLATVASPTDSTADGAGITILGATNKTFQWNNDGHGFTSSEDMNLASGHVYKINGEEILSSDGAEAILSLNDGPANVRVQNNWVKIGGGYFNVEGAMEAEGTLLVDGVATFGADITASAGLDVAGAAHIAGAADFDAAVNMDDTLAVAGIASFASDITASANVDVAGNVNLAAASAYKINDIRAVELLDAGDGEYWTMLKGQGNAKVGIKPDVAFMYGPTAVILDAGTGQVGLGVNGLTVAPLATFNSDISASAGLDVAGAAHVAGAADFDAAVNMDDTLAVAGVASFASDVSASAGLDVAGAAHFADAVDMDSTLNVDGQADFQAAANFHDDVAMDAALNLSGSAFVNITTPVVDGKYNVNDAIRALDEKAGTMSSNINNNYNALRYLAAANFDANGMAAFTSSFAAAAIEQVTVDVLVQAGGSGPWTNDLVSVQVKPAGSFVAFEISAPAMGASDKVRLIAVKESGSLA